MASQAKINAYMERHKLSALFEDLMNKVLRDMPEEPMIYLLRTMYKKAGMEIPQNIRYGGLRKSTSDLNKSISPERPSRAQVSTSADDDVALKEIKLNSCLDVEGSRDYIRPWATSPTRRTKPKRSEEPTMSKKRPDWNPDNKTKISTFDELWETKKESAQASAVRKSASSSKPGWDAVSHGVKAVNAWASVGMDEKETYTSPNNPGSKKAPPPTVSEKDLLASEIVPLSLRSESTAATSQAVATSSKSRKTDSKRHKEEYGQLLSGVDKKSDDSGIGSDVADLNDDDDAIELLENADDLKNEGVRNIPASGYKLSRNVRHRDNEPRVKLNINVNPMSYDYSFDEESVRHFDGFDTEQSSPEMKESEEEEFESVSQVTGPRQPVWKLPDSDVDSRKIKPAVAKEISRATGLVKNKPDDKLSSVSRKSDKTWTNKETSQVTFGQAPDREIKSPSSVYSDSSSQAWMIPDDTEAASAYDWNQRVKGGPRQDPRAY